MSEGQASGEVETPRMRIASISKSAAVGSAVGDPAASHPPRVEAENALVADDVGNGAAKAQWFDPLGFH